MKIETRFSIGDEVYAYLHYNETIVVGKVSKVEITCLEDSNSVSYNVTCGKKEKETCIIEEYINKDLDELKQSVIRYETQRVRETEVER